MALLFSSLTIPPAKSVNAAASQRRLTMAADRALIPVTYGQDRVPALVLNVLLGADPSITLIQAVWGHGCHEVSLPRLNGLALPSGATATHYTGGQSTADADLVAAFAAQSITYTDTLEGYAYSVFHLPTVLFTGQLELTAWIKGRKLYDPRKDSTAGGSGSHRLADPATWEWSENPALCLADWIASTDYGAGETVQWASVPAAANANDATIGSPAERRRIIGLTISQAAGLDDMAEALRAYAGCWLVPTSTGVRLVPDADDSPVATYSHASGDIAEISALQLPDRSAAPTVVEVVYTDNSGDDVREASAQAELPGAGTTLPWRLSRVRLPGIHRYSQALREAIERLNKLTLEGLATTLEVFDVGIRHERGDIIQVTHPIGLTAAPMRVLYVDMPAPGRWRLDLMRHDPLSYSDEVQTATTGPLTDRVIAPGPASDVTGAAATVSAGLIRVTWDPCPDIGYDSTEVREVNSDWGSYISPPLYRGKASEFPYLVTAVGSYTFYLRHISNGNPSANTVTATITVSEGDLPSAGGAAATLVLTPPLVTLQADSAGVVASWAGASTTATVVNADGSDDTGSGWVFTKADIGVTSTIAGNVVTVSGWSTVPADVDPYWTDVVFVSRFNETVEDEKGGRALGFILPGATTPVWHTGADDTYIQLGTASGATAGINWGVHTVEPHADLQCETGDLCVEARVILDALPGRPRHFVALYADGDERPIYMVGYTESGAFMAVVRTGATTQAVITGGTPVIGAVAHVALVRAGDVHRLYVNGAVVGSPQTVTYRHPSGPRRLVMGASYLFPTSANPYTDYMWGRIGWARITRSTRGYTTAGFTPAANPPLGYKSQAAVDVTATKGSVVLTKRFDLLVSRSAQTGQGGISQTISAPGITIAAAWDGVVSSYAGAAVTVAVLRNQVPITSLYAYTVSLPSGCTASMSGATLTVSSLTTAYTTGTATISATRSGYPTLTWAVPVTKALAARPAQVASVDKPLITLAGDVAGTVTSFAGAVATAKVLEGGTDATTGYTWTRSASSGITTTIAGAAVTITAIDAATDSGAITITGTKASWPTVVLTVQVAKTRVLPVSGAPVAQMTARTAYAGSSTSTAAKARFRRDGTVQVWDDTGAAWVDSGHWYYPTTTGIGDTHYLRMTTSSSLGAATGTFNSWQAISTDREFTVTNPGGSGTNIVSALALISTSSTGATILGQGSITLVAESFGS